jgi:hypothetical protein
MQNKSFAIENKHFSALAVSQEESKEAPKRKLDDFKDRNV